MLYEYTPFTIIIDPIYSTMVPHLTDRIYESSFPSYAVSLLPYRTHQTTFQSHRRPMTTTTMNDGTIKWTTCIALSRLPADLTNAVTTTNYPQPLLQIDSIHGGEEHDCEQDAGNCDSQSGMEREEGTRTIPTQRGGRLGADGLSGREVAVAVAVVWGRRIG